MIIKLHIIGSFIAAAACFIWLAITNSGNPTGSRGTIVTYELPAYILPIIIGQFFFFLPFQINPNTHIHSPVFKKVIKKKESPKLHKFLFYIPCYIGVGIILFGVFNIVSKELLLK